MRKRRLSEPYLLEETGGLNLTPLIDVVFVVLILFILIAPMLQLDRIQLASGSSSERNPSIAQESSPVTIHVREDNTILINQKCAPLEQLPAILQALHAKQPKATPQLFHDRKAYFGTYQSVKNAVEVAGFEELDVILQPGQ